MKIKIKSLLIINKNMAEAIGKGTGKMKGKEK